MAERTALFAVHAVRPDAICATDAIWGGQLTAEEHARALSTDPGVLAGAVTRYVLDTLGERKPIALFVEGERQEVPHLSDDRQTAANGWIKHPSLRNRSGKRGGA